jgi:AraC-like DNA-binding protein
MREVAQRVGLSQRQYIARFDAEVGLTPNRFCRIQRFQRALLEIERRKAIGWADLAVACGFFDQSHFIHEFQAFAGLNPSAYLTHRGEYLNYVPIRERAECASLQHA